MRFLHTTKQAQIHMPSHTHFSPLTHLSSISPPFFNHLSPTTPPFLTYLSTITTHIPAISHPSLAHIHTHLTPILTLIGTSYEINKNAHLYHHLGAFFIRNN